MPRIPDEVIERLKREVSLEALARNKGIELRGSGDTLVGRCPFHGDSSPSFVITPSKNLWHCLGACQTGGSVIDFVMRIEGVRFPLAVEMLKRDIPSLAASSASEAGARRPPKENTALKLEPLAEPDEADEVVIARVLAHYATALRESPLALEYLNSRGLEHPELIDHFRLGYANRTLGFHVPRANRASGEALRGQLSRIGLFRENGREHFYGCLTVPIFDAEGQLAQMYGRKVQSQARGLPQHLYLPRPHTAVWNEAALAEGREVILCEALLDALTFWCAGYRNVISAYGIEGLTPAHFAALKAHGTTKVLIAYDRDEAGEKAAQKLAPELAAQGLEVFRVVFPRGMDANEYAQKVQPAEKSLGTALRAAQWLAGTRPVAAQWPVVGGQWSEENESGGGSDAPASPSTSEDVSEIEPSPIHPLAASPEASAAGEERATEAPAVAAPAAPAAALPALPRAAPPSPPHAPASPSGPSAPPPPPAPLAVKDGEAVLSFGPRTWRIRGLDKVTSLASMKVNVRVSTSQAFFMDSFDVCQARARGAFTKQAAEELELEERVIKLDLAQVLHALEGLVEEQLKRTLTPAKATAAMSAKEEAAALALLRDPKLLERIVTDFDRCGVVGEETNKLIAYLAATSRKLPDPLALVIQSSSAAGKSSLMDAVLRFVPEEEKAAYAAMTGQALFYMGEANLQHKVLAIAEEEGAKHAAYALKILQSSGELTIASTGKDEATGKLATHEYRVTGPVMIMMTTTAAEVDEELLNRCLVVTVDEGAEQTRAIHARQREAETLEGMAARAAEQTLFALHQNAQRLLKPLRVVNPFAKELSFASHATRTRRDHKKYLALIRAIALLHQHQRPVREYRDEASGTRFSYIEATREDVAVAERLCGQVLARSLDELAPQTRRLLEAITRLVDARSAAEALSRDAVRFTQRELRDTSSMSATQVKLQLRRLVDLEYVLMRPDREHRQRLFYSLVCSDGPTGPHRSETGPSSHGPVLSRDVVEMSQPVREFRSTVPALRAQSASYVHPSSVDAAE